MSNNGIIRILVNQECMYNCFFCHKEGIERMCKQELDIQDILFLVEEMKKIYNKNEIRISGGEPLLRKDIIEIAKKISEEDIKVLITSNGSLLKEKEEICKYLKKLNVSIHSLNAEKYKEITKSSVNVNEILDTIKTIRKKYPKLNITIDTTLLKDINTSKSEIEEYIKFGEDNKINIKFIELFKTNKELFYSVDNIRELILEKGYEKIWEDVRREEYKKNGISIILAKCFCVAYKEREKLGKICKESNDLFITADGKISVCRLDDREINILKEIKHRDEDGLIKKFNKAYEEIGNYCINGKG